MLYSQCLGGQRQEDSCGLLTGQLMLRAKLQARWDGVKKKKPNKKQWYNNCGYALASMGVHTHSHSYVYLCTHNYAQKYVLKCYEWLYYWFINHDSILLNNGFNDIKVIRKKFGQRYPTCANQAAHKRHDILMKISVAGMGYFPTSNPTIWSGRPQKQPKEIDYCPCSSWLPTRSRWKKKKRTIA